MFEAPVNWLKTIENIRRVRRQYPAPVDSMGCDKVHNKSDKDVNQRFQILVSLMLSSQTKDPITWAAVQKLREAGLTNVQALKSANEKDIEDLIHPVGFYRRKAVYLKKVADILDQKYGGDIPDNLKDLCNLPGVGPKMAHLCMLEAWNVLSGIGVDTHVHRIAARLAWVPKTGIKSPEDTRKALESWLPREYWREINHLLVGFGQTICTPIRPKCNQCANNSICPSVDLKGTKKQQAIKKEDGNNNENADKFTDTLSSDIVTSNNVDSPSNQLGIKKEPIEVAEAVELKHIPTLQSKTEERKRKRQVVPTETSGRVLRKRKQDTRLQ